jgi:Zn-dependent M28 family amino/carboxypeptidase
MRAGCLLLVALTACGGDETKTLSPTDPADLMTTLQDLAQFGQRQPGTPAGKQASDYIAERFRTIGLADVHTETFTVPAWSATTKTFTLSIDGVESSPGFDVFEASGSGIADGEIVDCGSATDAALVDKDLTGKIALVKRETSFHRSAQLRNVAAKGATAMLYLSVAPENLRQVGSVRFGWNATEAIPAITIGADDGQAIKDALAASQTVTAHIELEAVSAPAEAINVVGMLEGERPEVIVLGAHYDSWFTGSSDNSSGIAELLAIAARQKAKGKPKYTLAFVAYDGEETGLYGGYDYYRKHKIAGGDQMLAVLNFESPSAKNPDIAGLAHSNQPELDRALQAATLRGLYGLYVGMEAVAQLFGGIIPTDIQGVYRGGTPAVSTAVTNPYYHTMNDTPDKVDLDLLVNSTDAFDTAVDLLGELTPDDFAVADPELWTADVVTAQNGDMLDLTVTVRDGAGALQPDARVDAAALHDDFMLTDLTTAMTDASGVAHLQLPASIATAGAGNRFLHITAGPTYPLVEKIEPL